MTFEGERGGTFGVAPWTLMTQASAFLPAGWAFRAVSKTSSPASVLLNLCLLVTPQRESPWRIV